MECPFCDGNIESIQSPIGLHAFCEDCGAEFCDAEYMDHRRRQREDLLRMLNELPQEDA